MNDRILVTYSLLNYIWEENQDILDTYIPLVCSCIQEKAVSEITRENIIKWLKEKYGISNITLGVSESIINRMVRKKLIKKDMKGCLVESKKVIETVKEKLTHSDIDKDFSSIIDGVIDYAKTQFYQTFTKKDVEDGVLIFLQNHDSDLLFQTNGLYSSLSKQKESRDKRNALKLKYIISRYLLDCKDKDKNILAKMINLAKGHALASLISFQNLSSYQGKLDKVCIALDSPIIYGILNLSDSTELIIELLERLKELGAKFIIFDENYNEVCNTLQTTIKMLPLFRESRINIKHTSRLFRYAVRNNISTPTLQLHLQQLDDSLEKWNIKKTSTPSKIDGYKEIDVKKLKDIISNGYQKAKDIELEEYQIKLIENDANTISNIYRIRGISPAINLKKCKALLLTMNNIIASASNDKSISNIYHIIPPCMTDVTLSTILWVNFPMNNNNLNERLLMSECFRNIAINDSLLKSYYNQIKKLHKKQIITQEQVLAASTMSTIKLLEQKTFNNEEFYTDKTTEEILQEMKIKNDEEIKKKDEKLKFYDNKLDHIAGVCSYAIYWTLWICMLLLFIVSKLVNIKKWDNIQHILVNVLLILPALFGICTYCGCIPTKADIIRKIKNRIYKGLKKKFEA